MSKQSTITIPVNAGAEISSLIPAVTAQWAFGELVNLTIKLSSGSIGAGDYVLALVYPKTPKASHALLASTDETNSTALTLSAGELTGVLSTNTTDISTALTNSAESYIDVWMCIWDEEADDLLAKVSLRLYDNPYSASLTSPTAVADLSFLNLSDVTTTTYTGQAAKVVAVNAGETGLELVAAGSGSVSTSGTPVANDIARFTAAAVIEGLSYAELRAAINVADGADVTGSNQAATVATITGLAPDTATTAAAQANITSLGTLTGLTVSGLPTFSSPPTGSTHTTSSLVINPATAASGVLFWAGVADANLAKIDKNGDLTANLIASTTGIYAEAATIRIQDSGNYAVIENISWTSGFHVGANTSATYSLHQVRMGTGSRTQVTMGSSLSQDDVVIKRDVNDGVASWNEAGSLLHLWRDVTLTGGAASGNFLECSTDGTTPLASINKDALAWFGGGIRTKVDVSDIADPPTDANLDAAFGTPAALGDGFIGIVDDNSGDTDVWLCYTSDTSWFYLQGTKAV